MTEQQPPIGSPEVNPEFFLRVNDILEQATRVERRLDTNHAQLVMLHAFSRYSAHHFRTAVKPEDDSAEERARFADYIATIVRGSIGKHIDEIAGAPQSQAAAQEEKDA